MRFDDKVVVVTGAAQGIGKAACRRFLEQGAKVAMWDMNGEKLSAAAKELDPNGERIMTVIVNVADRASVNELLICSQPAHLQKLQGSKLTAEERDAKRASLIRRRLGAQS